jgi:cytochrome c-type biogenesis protein CcmF
MKSSMELSMVRGQTAQASNAYALRFLGAEEVREPHRISTIARFAVLEDGKQIATLAPRMNQYAMMREAIGTPDVHTTAMGDLYLSVLQVDVAGQSVAVNVVNTPFVVWIWISVLLMGFGGLFALIPSRRRSVIPSAVEGSPATGHDRRTSAGDPSTALGMTREASDRVKTGTAAEPA